MSHPYPEEDQMVPCTPETKSDYDLSMTLSPTPVSADVEPFEDEEEPSKEEENPDDEISGAPTDS